MPASSTIVEPVLLAIGVTSTLERREMRDAQRASWLRRLPMDVKAHFILRGLGLTSDDRLRASAEAAQHHDIKFVAARSNLSRAMGPLNSVFLWMRCAAVLYPSAPFVGKAEDDTWVHSEALAVLLRSSVLPWVGKPYEAYVGAIATYHWSEHVDGGPIGYREIPCSLDCAVPNRSAGGRVVGPFNFVKGPLVVLSAGLARRVGFVAPHEGATAVDDPRCLRGSSWFWRPTHQRTQGISDDDELSTSAAEDGYADACGASIDANSTWAAALHTAAGRYGTVAWDDVWVGYALSQLRTHRVAVLGFGDELFDDTWGFAAKSTAIYWHSRADADVSRRMAGLQGWIDRGACSEALRHRALRASAFRVSCHPKRKDGTTFLTCARQPWLLCRVRALFARTALPQPAAAASNSTTNATPPTVPCSTVKTDLWGQPNPLTGEPITPPVPTKLVRVRCVWMKVPAAAPP